MPSCAAPPQHPLQQRRARGRGARERRNQARATDPRVLARRMHFAAIAATSSAATPPLQLRPSAPPFEPRHNAYRSHAYAVAHGLADGPPPSPSLSIITPPSRETAPPLPPPLAAVDSPTRETAPPPSAPLSASPPPAPEVPPLPPRSFAAVAALVATSPPPPPPLDRKAYGSRGSSHATLAASLDALDFDSEHESELLDFSFDRRFARTRARVTRQAYRSAARARRVNGSSFSL